MALSLLFFGLNRYSIIDSFRRDYFILLLNVNCLSVCHSFFADIILFVPKLRLKIKIKQSC